MRPGTAGLLCLALALPAAVDAQVGVAPLDGGWVRVDSNNQPNDRMRIRVQGRAAVAALGPVDRRRLGAHRHARRGR